MAKTAWQLALDYLSRRACTRAEIRRRLARGGFGEEETAAAVAKLERLALVDDREVAYNHARRRAEQGRRGVRRVRLELRQRGLEPDLIDEVLAEVFPPEGEEEAFVRAVRTLAPGGKIPEDRPGRIKLARRLVRAGFPESLAARLLDGGFGGEEG